MPLLSTFYGIIVRMNNTREHNPPHIHVSYSGTNALFDFDGNILEGDIPKNKKQLVQAWIIIHRDELIASWELAMNHEPLPRIDPLK